MMTSICITDKFLIHKVMCMCVCVFEVVYSSVRQADRPRVSVDQGKVSEPAVIHAGHVRDI